MQLAELKDKLRSFGIFPIQVIDTIDPDEAQGLSFDGELDEYLEAVKSLGKTHVFIASQELEEDAFTYSLEGEQAYDEAEEECGYEVEEFDLCLANAGLRKFKEKIGQTGIYKLFTSATEDSLNYYPQEDWWTEYMVLYVETVEHVKNHKRQTQETLKAAQKEKTKELIKALHGLKNDAAFKLLKTQRAMSNYAKEAIPDLDTLEPSVLRQEIQFLYDKLR